MSDYSINLADRTKYVKGVNDIIQSWNIILSTIPGSIPLRPQFGSNLYKYIDQPVNAAFASMANTIIRDLEKWEKRAKVKKVTKTVSGSNIKIVLFGIYNPNKEEIITDIEIVDNEKGGIGYMIIGSTFIIK